MLLQVSPIDGRYASKTKELAPYFSEFALIKYRVFVEIEYLISLSTNAIPNHIALSDAEVVQLRKVMNEFNESHAQTIKDTEAITNHDVKAVEYFVKSILENMNRLDILEYVHFGLTSQDINNTALPLMVKEALHDVYLPHIENILTQIQGFSKEWEGIPMLAKTHGQPASPTSMGKEFKVYEERIQSQLDLLKALPIKAKFGGATGNFNAHKVAFSDVDWKQFGDAFINSLGLVRMQYTTQIAHYDHFAAIFHAMSRINTILVDLCQDIWTYVSMEYFKQKVIKNEVGSSAMPHKVNPIDFENAEGNLKLANAIFGFLAEKLPVSRLQRDLTDSTVGRNIGVPIAHSLISFKSIIKGFGKLILNEAALQKDLDNNWAVVAEAIQNILRRESYPKPYEALKALTRGHDKITQQIIHDFIGQLEVSEAIKTELKAITPFNYIGYV